MIKAPCVLPRALSDQSGGFSQLSTGMAVHRIIRSEDAHCENAQYDFPEKRLRRVRMIEYEMRILAADGRLRWAIALFCPDDEGAKEYARQVVDRYDVELWRGDRQIERFNHAP